MGTKCHATGPHKCFECKIEIIFVSESEEVIQDSTNNKMDQKLPKYKIWDSLKRPEILKPSCDHHLDLTDDEDLVSSQAQNKCSRPSLIFRHCGHSSFVKCHERENKTTVKKCQEPCGKVRSCKHTCESVCHFKSADSSLYDCVCKCNLYSFSLDTQSGLFSALESCIPNMNFYHRITQDQNHLYVISKCKIGSCYICHRRRLHSTCTRDIHNFKTESGKVVPHDECSLIFNNKLYIDESPLSNENLNNIFEFLEIEKKLKNQKVNFSKKEIDFNDLWSKAFPLENFLPKKLKVATILNLTKEKFSMQVEFKPQQLELDRIVILIEFLIFRK